MVRHSYLRFSKFDQIILDQRYYQKDLWPKNVLGSESLEYTMEESMGLNICSTWAQAFLW